MPGAQQELSVNCHHSRANQRDQMCREERGRDGAQSLNGLLTQNLDSGCLMPTIGPLSLLSVSCATLSENTGWELRPHWAHRMNGLYDWHGTFMLPNGCLINNCMGGIWSKTCFHYFLAPWLVGSLPLISSWCSPSSCTKSLRIVSDQTGSGQARVAPEMGFRSEEIKGVGN